MGKEYIVQGAMCMCKFGAAPGILKVTDNKGVYMNGKLTATTMTLGNVFNPPGFGVCKINPLFPKPCTPAVTQWMGFYDGITINGSSNPLTDSSQGTCASGCPNCITFQMTGQIPVPGLAQMKQAAAAHQNDINPMGSPEALDENAEDGTPIIKKVEWRDAEGEKVIDEIPADGIVTIYAEVENAKGGEAVSFKIRLEDGREAEVSGTCDGQGVVKINNYDIQSQIK
ncbi:DUF4280 domain-containing protein [Culturomica massiliensis]|uniref:DUF4280 domain-containing protein n=1 Tax=Culturomica massiliensis TaxID=1841857 RepID=UPI003AB786EF